MCILIMIACFMGRFFLACNIGQYMFGVLSGHNHFVFLFGNNYSGFKLLNSSHFDFSFACFSSSA